MKLIDKDALIMEIKRKIKYNHERAHLDKSPSMAGREKEDKDILSFIDNLEVKEMDLEKNISNWYYHLNIPENYNIPQTVMVIDIVEKTAKHFFELGLKAKKGE